LLENLFNNYLLLPPFKFGYLPENGNNRAYLSLEFAKCVWKRQSCNAWHVVVCWQSGYQLDISCQAEMT